MYKIAFVYPEKLPSGGDQLKYLKSSSTDKTCYYLYISQGFNLLDNIYYQKICFEGSTFDISSIDKEFDAIIIWDLFEYGITYKNIKNSKAVICGSCPDVHTLNESMVYLYQEYNIDFFYHNYSKIAYENIMRSRLGLDPERCDYKFMPRGISETAIINSPAINLREGPTGFLSKKVLISGVTGHFSYALRKTISESNDKNIISVEQLKENQTISNFNGDGYYELLRSTSAHIAACETFTGKLFESLGCGALTFVQVGKDTDPAEAGLIDGVNCIFINEENWNYKIRDYLSTSDDSKWAKIAAAGERLAINRYSTKACASKIVDYCKIMSDVKNA